MTETLDETLLQQAKSLAYGLAITVYIRDGRIYQTPPGKEIVPPTNAHPELAGRGPDFIKEL